MSASAPPDRPTGVREGADRPSFLASHRALAVCARELERLVDHLERDVEALHAQGIIPKPNMRRSPGRWILQIGPVAITLSWLRGTLDTAADGELLVIGWRGEVLPRPTLPTSPVRRVVQTAVQLWEDLLVAEATAEADWCWRLKKRHGSDKTSPELAGQWSARLRLAYLASQDGQ